MKAKEKYNHNLFLMRDYLSQHPELNSLVSAFQSIAEAAKSITTISVGTRLGDNVFAPLLTSRVETPRIRFSTCDDIPWILVQNNLQTLCSLPLNDVRNLEITSNTTESRTDFQMYFCCNNTGYQVTAILLK